MEHKKCRGSTVTLNQYAGMSRAGMQDMVVAPDMETAAAVYRQQNMQDPTVLQCVKEGILVSMPESWVTFKTKPVALDPVQNPIVQGLCTATPGQYTVKAGSRHIFTATGATGWVFKHWTINGVIVDTDEGTEEVAMLQIPPSPTVVEINAVFEPKVGP